MQKYSISIVSYLNSFPFLTGLENSSLIDEIKLEKDIPSICANKLINKHVDIGLIPVAAFAYMPEYTIISDYCIGAERKVQSVILFSDVPINKIKKIYLDYHSRSSVMLTKVLIKNHWKISPEFENTTEGYINNIKNTTAGLVIGDRTFDLQNAFEYKYDLAEEWNKFSNLPFVFAAWTTHKDINSLFTTNFNQALEYGLNNLQLSVDRFEKENPTSKFDAMTYLKDYVSYDLTTQKRQGLEYFLRLCKEL